MFVGGVDQQPTVITPSHTGETDRSDTSAKHTDKLEA